MNRKVANSEFKHLKGICLRCLDENPDIVEKLDLCYKEIQVYFFYETADPNVDISITNTLKDQRATHLLKPLPAYTQSKGNVGLILIFTNHLAQVVKKRTDIEDVESDLKNGMFEEFCHLVEQAGDSSVHPNSYWVLWNSYRKNNQIVFGNEIIAQLDTDRNHYEVFSMMLRAYPNDWVKRYSIYNFQKPQEYEQQYEKWKGNIPINIIHARLVIDLLRTMNFLYVAEKAKKEQISEENKVLLESMLEMGEKDIEQKKQMLRKEMGSTALALTDSLEENIFRTPEIFFAIILDLWKNLHLI